MGRWCLCQDSHTSARLSRRSTGGVVFGNEDHTMASESKQREAGDGSMAEYIPSPQVWVRDQVELYESSGGKAGTTLRDTGLPVVIVTHIGRKTGAVRKTPLMRVVADDGTYALVGSKGGAPEHPTWYYNLREQSEVTIRDGERVFRARIHEAT